jgi:hypothetical protein
MYQVVMKVFGFIHKIIKKVMSFNASNVVVQGNTTSKIENTLSPNQLNVKEIEILLSLIKRSTFLGEDLEPLYNMVIKLQNQYIEQTK